MCEKTKSEDTVSDIEDQAGSDDFVELGEVTTDTKGGIGQWWDGGFGKFG